MATKAKPISTAIKTKVLPRLEAPIEIVQSARKASIQTALARILEPVLGIRDISEPEINIHDACELGRLALALKTIAEDLGGMDGVYDFEQAFKDDRCHGGGIDDVLFSNVLREDLA